MRSVTSIVNTIPLVVYIIIFFYFVITMWISVRKFLYPKILISEKIKFAHAFLQNCIVPALACSILVRDSENRKQVTEPINNVVQAVASQGAYYY